MRLGFSKRLFSGLWFNTSTNVNTNGPSKKEFNRVQAERDKAVSFAKELANLQEATLMRLAELNESAVMKAKNEFLPVFPTTARQLLIDLPDEYKERFSNFAGICMEMVSAYADTIIQQTELLSESQDTLHRKIKSLTKQT